MSFLATVGFTITSIIILGRKLPRFPIQFCSLTPLLPAAIKYSPIPKICYVTTSTSLLVAIWASPVGSH
jgi:hypothetical protein